MMKIGKDGINLIKQFEGCRLEAYLCPANVWTIGFGHTHGVSKGQQITEHQAEQLLIEDLREFERHVSRLVTVPLTQEQFDALVSFTFNLGPAALAGSTLLRLLNQGKYVDAAEQFMRWNKARNRDGELVALPGLTRRRKAEQDLFKGRKGER